MAGIDDEGAPAVRSMTLEDFHGDNAPRQEETDRTVQRSGNLVHVWSHYASARTPGGEPFDRGVNSISLFHDGDRWWIMGWMFDTSAD